MQSADFYPRSAMLARYWLLPAGTTVSVSVTSRSSIETDGRIELVFSIESGF